MLLNTCTMIIPPNRQSNPLRVLEQRYNDESLLMEYVAHGDFESIDKLAHLNSSGIKPRLSDSIRDRKNFMIILNTLCRKAAQSAYVHPIHLDEISRKFAIRIESCTTIAQLETPKMKSRVNIVCLFNLIL